MGKRDESRKLKVCILSMMKAKKHILFGTLSKSLTKEDKTRAWQEIHSYSKSLGVTPPTKDWTYLRDVWWPNARKSTMEKIDNLKKTDSFGGKEKLFNEVDIEVYEIIGKDSPNFNVIDVPGEPTGESRELLTMLNLKRVDSESGDPTHEASPINNIPRFISQTIEDSTEKALQIELMKLQIYKMKLECRKLEIEMGIPRSIHTDDIEDGGVLM